MLAEDALHAIAVARNEGYLRPTGPEFAYQGQPQAGRTAGDRDSPVG
jgi:hypothetical protein